MKEKEKKKYLGISELILCIIQNDSGTSSIALTWELVRNEEY